MRTGLIETFAAGVARAAPERAVARALDGARRPDLILALGKAARAMARAALDVFPGVDCLVVTNAENARDLSGARVLIGGHPVPDRGSAAAGAALLEAAGGLGTGRHCLVLVSGGGSALAVSPVAGVTLEDKAEVSRLLLGAGLDIVEMNIVRQALSALKGGGLARACAPATFETLVLSDVVGDDPAAIASGPTVAPIGDSVRARRVLEEAGLWDRIPARCRRAVVTALPREVPSGPVRMVGSNRLSVEAMLEAVPDARADPDPLVGMVADATARIVARAQEGAGMTLWGGETTVVLRGGGRGGRNQELALRVALALEGFDRRWAFLSGGTDGRDGPTDAAGGVVDDGTLARIAAAGLDARALLAENDAFPALEAAGDLLITGATGTNVADLQILRVGGLVGA